MIFACHPSRRFLCPSLAVLLFTLLAHQRLVGLSKTIVILLFQFLSQHVILYIYLFFLPNTDLGIWRWWVWGVGEALKVVYMSLRWFLRALKARCWIKVLFPSSQPAAWDELYLFQLITFFFTSLFLVISLKDNVPQCPCAFPLGIIIISQLCPPPSHPIFLCLNLQDPADSRALARSHLHRRRVFQGGANRLWQRPKVSEMVQRNKTQQGKALHFSMHR